MHMIMIIIIVVFVKVSLCDIILEAIILQSNIMIKVIMSLNDMITFCNVDNFLQVLPKSNQDPSQNGNPVWGKGERKTTQVIPDPIQA